MMIFDHGNVFAIGCPHFNHHRVIQAAPRPFKSVAEMNYNLMVNWNNVVPPSGVVLILGDVVWPKDNDAPEFTADPNEFFDLLHGQKIVIRGNHDSCLGIQHKKQYEIYQYLEIMYRNTMFVLFHYPIHDWNNRFKGSIHLHSHDHLPDFMNHNQPYEQQSGLSLGVVGKKYPVNRLCNRFRVNVEAINYTPVHLDTILEASHTGVNPFTKEDTHA